ncbi:uncharacterized protein LOC110814544 [Carica papaya]|uniref:uncharacterized protein LOC110814544 n=1 Tax=Carica papaya TaxID=3649 RepID=UPI000B8CC23B|nr:uncharacterized protein LOC110814544 [Carica papaya]
MEDQCGLLTWGNCFQEEGMEELKHTLLYTTLELETTILSAKEEITRRELELIQLKEVLAVTMKEKEEAVARCQRLVHDKLVLQQELQQNHHKHQFLHHQQKQEQELALQIHGSSSSEDESIPVKPKRGLDTSDCYHRQMGSSPGGESIPQLPEEAMKLAAKKPLPEKGKLLQAVMEAGPLLQTLLLAGPLPQWQHPPPQLDSNDIPPVGISSPTSRLVTQTSFNNLNHSCLSKKRSADQLFDCSELSSSPETKHQKSCSPLN